MGNGPPDRRRFACTACGRCCDRGPEMEIGEAAALADVFVFSLIFKAHSLPASERSRWAKAWWRAQNTRRGPSAALEEQRRQLKPFAARKIVDGKGDRHVFITMSAIVDDRGEGVCPALSDKLCGIYERRPLTCRTVPLHYSRAPSTLAAYLDGFVRTPGYACETEAAPEVLDGPRILDREVAALREDALARAETDRAWKAAMAAIMDEPASARAAGLPTFGDVLTNSDRGFASTAPMIVAWRVARRSGLMTGAEFGEACRRQIALLEAARTTGRPGDVDGKLADARSALLEEGI